MKRSTTKPHADRRVPVRPAKRAFTLVELLVVVSVIAILAALLMPALSQAKERARRAGCINNENQLAVTWAMYAGDNNDRLVANGRIYHPGGSPDFMTWVQGVYVENDTNSALLFSSEYALFAPYVFTTRIYHCPSDAPTFNVNGVPFEKYRSYALNCFMGWTGQWIEPFGSPSAVKVFSKSTDIIEPVRFFTFQDVYARSICGPFFGVAMWDTDTVYNYPFIDHNQGGVVSFADGHVGWHRWHDPRTLSPKSIGFHRHDDPSPNNVDVDWLKYHATILTGSPDYTLPGGLQTTGPGMPSAPAN